MTGMLCFAIAASDDHDIGRASGHHEWKEESGVREEVLASQPLSLKCLLLWRAPDQQIRSC